jgi:O-antigen chain-terminating methyltransferase
VSSQQSSLDGAALMDAVRAEAARGGASAAGRATPTSLDEIIRFVEAQAGSGAGRRSAAVAPSAASAGQGRWKPLASRIEPKSQYTLHELLPIPDSEFVEAAYRLVLKRAPDPEGFDYYLSQLRGGMVSKIEILGQLRWSPEGVARSVHIDGLLLPYKLHSMERKRVLGPVLRWLHGLVRIGEMQRRQTMMDNNQDRELLELGRHVESSVWEAVAKAESVESRMAFYDSRLSAELNDINSSVRGFSRYVEGAQNEKDEAERSEQALEPLYAAFEAAFRGSRETIMRRCEPYVAWIEQSGAGSEDAPILDIGCGRGEWLQLLNFKGKTAKGVDLNGTFVEECRSIGLDVVRQDAVAYLKSLPDGSLGAITSMHLVEHLPFEVMIALIDEALRVLRPGGILALETPNPENLTVGAHWFYMDPTHRNPIPPLALRWLVEERGFAESRIERLTYARESTAPAKVDDSVPGAATINALVELVSAPTDYAIVGVKA